MIARTADCRGGAGRGQGAEVSCAFAADQSYGHRADAERRTAPALVAIAIVVV
jgi:hypothetical protein